MTWNPPESPSLSTSGIDHVVAGLTAADTRDTASAYLDEIEDSGLLYVIACRIGGRYNKPAVGASAAGFRTFIRNRI
jgi:hypothetical protein